MNKAAFLDRDGTIIYDPGYLSDPDKIEFLPGAINALEILHKNAYLLIVTTNQSGVARGFFKEETVLKIHERMQHLIREKINIKLDGLFYCPHGPDENCLCRKPAPGMIFEAKKKFNIDLKSSAVFGDKESDIIAGISAGCRYNFFIKGSHKPPENYKFVFNSLLDAVKYLTKETKGEK